MSNSLLFSQSHTAVICTLPTKIKDSNEFIERVGKPNKFKLVHLFIPEKKLTMKDVIVIGYLLFQFSDSCTIHVHTTEINEWIISTTIGHHNLKYPKVLFDTENSATVEDIEYIYDKDKNLLHWV